MAPNRSANPDAPSAELRLRLRGAGWLGSLGIASMQTNELTRNLNWSSAEKKIARAAFDAALERERAAARREVERILLSSPDSAEIWHVRDYLNEKAREIDTKYDYRYSVLIHVFAQLVAQGWLTLDELAGLHSEKLGLIQRASVYWSKRDA